ncbi:TRAP transporter large permease [Acuticoccus kandeliae]|uniref:TRAP transporter large permease n=1 Tax=Acuticoccus kandeliae TaxID=2073160 RepID=UPI000D3E9AD0|nr:TRAP transporter large permease [Acuticoccus kandeliae]
MSVYLICLVILIFLLIRVPVFIAIGSGCAIYFLTNNYSLATVAARFFYSIDIFSLLAIPLFVLAGNLMNRSGVTERIFRFCNSLVAAIPGGLGHVNVMCSLIFAGMSGSALADLGSLGRIEVKAMREAGYPLPFSMGVTLASSSLGPVIPPSIAAIVYAINAKVSVAGLFLASIVPGLFLGLMMMLFVSICAIRGNFPRHELRPLRQVWRDFLSALPAMVTPALLIGGMTAGIFSPTEAAAVAVLYSLFLGLVVYRALRIGEIWPCLVESSREVASLLLVVAVGIVFGWILTVERVPQDIAAFMVSVSGDATVLLLLVVALALVLGCFMEVTVLLLLLPPIILPPLLAAGVDPLQVGVVLIITVSIGMFTPPFGVGLFAMQRIAGARYADVVIGFLPWLVPLLLSVVILVLFPGIVLFLPRALGF